MPRQARIILPNTPHHIVQRGDNREKGKRGQIDGEVTTISNDATVDEQRGLIYGMHLLMKKNTIQVDNREVRLMPGMAVTAEVKTGTRRIIEFFLAPLLRYKQESIRER